MSDYLGNKKTKYTDSKKEQTSTTVFFVNT